MSRTLRQEFVTVVMGEELVARREGRGWSVIWKDARASGRSLVEVLERLVGRGGGSAVNVAVEALLAEMDREQALGRETRAYSRLEPPG